MYKKLIVALSKYKDGKYSNQIKGIRDFDLESDSKKIKTGVNDSRESYGYDLSVKWIDELLNETEALELTGSNDIQEIWPLQDNNERNSSSGNYVNVYNYISAYSTFTGYGPILKSILGKEDTFKAEYISSVNIFKQFDQEYADIVQEVWGDKRQKYSPMECIFTDFNDLLKHKYFNEEIMLKLDEFFAKCYERKIEKVMAQSNGVLTPEQIKTTLKEIETFQSRLTTNNNIKKRDNLAHNIVFNNIKTRIQERTVQHEQPSSEHKVKMQADISINEFAKNIRPTRNKQESSNKKEIKQIKSTEITELLNQDLLKQKIQLPNGAEISAKQYIQEVVSPYIPSSGKFMLKSGVEISAVQFIEKAILENNNSQMKGNITELLENYTKANNGLINFRGEQINPVDIVGSLNPKLMSQKVGLPNGTEISARQYIQEVVAPYIPSSGKFMLKNGVELPASQFIEEVVLGQIGDYQGDVRALLEGTVKANNGIIDIENKKKDPIGQELKQERGVSQAEAKRIEEQEYAEQERIEKEEKQEKQRDEKKGISEQSETIGIQDVKKSIMKAKVTQTETEKQTLNIKKKQDMFRISIKKPSERTAEEQAAYEEFERQKNEAKTRFRGRQHSNSKGMTM